MYVQLTRLHRELLLHSLLLLLHLLLVLALILTGDHLLLLL